MRSRAPHRRVVVALLLVVALVQIGSPCSSEVTIRVENRTERSIAFLPQSAEFLARYHLEIPADRSYTRSGETFGYRESRFDLVDDPIRIIGVTREAIVFDRTYTLEQLEAVDFRIVVEYAAEFTGRVADAQGG